MGEPITATVMVFNNTGVFATLVGYVDLNGDGMWSADETVTTLVPTSDSPQLISLSFDTVTDVSDLYARFRLTTDANVMPDGVASDGEVEDYLFASPTAVQLSQVFAGNGTVTLVATMGIIMVTMTWVARRRKLK